MKFKNKNDYDGGVAQMLPTAPIENVQPTGSTFTWDCMACKEKATVLHRGTAYCRRCYDQRNLLGTLIN